MASSTAHHRCCRRHRAAQAHRLQVWKVSCCRVAPHRACSARKEAITNNRHKGRLERLHVHGIGLGGRAGGWVDGWVGRRVDESRSRVSGRIRLRPSYGCRHFHEMCMVTARRTNATAATSPSLLPYCALCLTRGTAAGRSKPGPGASTPKPGPPSKRPAGKVRQRGGHALRRLPQPCGCRHACRKGAALQRAGLTLSTGPAVMDFVISSAREAARNHCAGRCRWCGSRLWRK